MTKLIRFALVLVILTSGLTAIAAGTPQGEGDGVRRITPAELRAALKKGKAVLIDVRGLGAFQSGHIKGALTIPVNEINVRYSELPKDKLIATYCS